MVSACTLALGIGAFWIAISVTKEIQRILHSINNKSHETEIQTNEMMDLFSEYIDAHGIVKQLSIFLIVKKLISNPQNYILFRVESDFSDIFQPIIMSVFTWSLFAISGFMFIIQLEIVEYTLVSSHLK